MAGFMGSARVSDSLSRVFSRALTGQIANAYFYLEVFPERIDYLLGASFPNPGGLLPFDPFPLTTTMDAFISPHLLGSGVIGSALTVFWAEMYANFGPVGIPVVAFAVGIGLYAMSHVLGRLPASAGYLAAAASLAMHYRTLVGTGISQYLFDTNLIAVAAVTLVVLALGRRHRWLVGPGARMAPGRCSPTDQSPAVGAVGRPTETDLTASRLDGQ